MLFSAIISFTVSVTKAIVTLGLAAEGLTAIGNALTAIGKTLGLIRPETQVEDLGDQALQAEEAGITPDAFDAYEDYVKAVESFQLDPEKSKQFTPEEKVKKGIELAIGVTAERFPEVSVETFSKLSTLVHDYPSIFNEKSMEVLAKKMASFSGSADDVIGYLDCTEKNQSKLANGESILTEMIKAAKPGTDAAAVRNLLNNFE